LAGSWRFKLPGCVLLYAPEVIETPARAQQQENKDSYGNRTLAR
jgi:hypothetical protein